jgi:hypothetical protein
MPKALHYYTIAQRRMIITTCFGKELKIESMTTAVIIMSGKVMVGYSQGKFCFMFF